MSRRIFVPIEVDPWTFPLPPESRSIDIRQLNLTFALISYQGMVNQKSIEFRFN